MFSQGLHLVFKRALGLCPVIDKAVGVGWLQRACPGANLRVIRSFFLLSHHLSATSVEGVALELSALTLVLLVIDF